MKPFQGEESAHSEDIEGKIDELINLKPIGLEDSTVITDGSKADNCALDLSSEKVVKESADGSMYRAFDRVLDSREQVVDFMMEVMKMEDETMVQGKPWVYNREGLLKNFDRYFMKGMFTTDLGVYEVTYQKGKFHIAFLAKSGITLRELGEYTAKLALITPETGRREGIMRIAV